MTPNRPDLMPQNATSNADRMAAVHFMVYEMWRDIQGTGTPGSGLKDRVTKLESAQLTATEAAPSKTEKVGVPAAVASVATAVIIILTSVFGLGPTP